MDIHQSISKVKVAIGSWLFHPAIGRALTWRYHGLIPFGNDRFELRTGNHVSYKETARLFWGYYEKSERLLVLRHLRSDLDVIEVGSGVGVISCCILRAQAPEKFLVCVEANPAAAATLLQNIRRNYPGRQFVRIVNGAIDYSGAKIASLQVDENLISSSVRQAGNSVTAVPALTLSQLQEDSSLESFALVCDIEGAEAGLLENEAKVLESCKQIIIELHATRFKGNTYSISDLRRLIENMGFALRARRGNVFAYERACSQAHGGQL